MSTPTTTAAPSIEIPRLPDETPRAYAARVAYLTMGPGRSLDKVAGQKGGREGARPNNTAVENWSRKYGWPALAAQYDATLATLAARAHAEEYQRDLEDHRKRYQQAGRALYGVAVEMLASLRKSQATIEYTPATLSTIARALTVAGDLEAHALRVADLLPRLNDDSE